MRSSGNLNEATLGPRRHRAVLDWANEFGGMYHLRFAWVNVRPTTRMRRFLLAALMTSHAHSVSGCDPVSWLCRSW